MRTCDWPEGCPRPVRANGKCAPHDVMWARKHGRPKTPKPRGVKATKPPRAGNALSRPNLHLMLDVLRTGAKPLWRIANYYGTATSAATRAIRQLEASGLKVRRTSNPENGREVLRHVTEAEAVRYLKALAKESK